MIITLQQEKNSFYKDIKVNREQKIEDTLLILYEGGILSEKIDFEDSCIYSQRLGKCVNISNTYEQAGIFNGDILSIMRGKE